jgi:hypothetical protein
MGSFEVRAQITKSSGNLEKPRRPVIKHYRNGFLTLQDKESHVQSMQGFSPGQKR